MFFGISDSLVLIVVLVILYKLVGRFFDWRAGTKQRNAAIEATRELDRQIVAQRRAEEVRQRALAMKPPPPPPPSKPAPATYDHIPRIAFDLDTQLEFGGSRYHTWYVSPEMSDRFEVEPGLYVTDLRDGPELIGASSQKRIFIPYEQLIKR